MMSVVLLSFIVIAVGCKKDFSGYTGEYSFVKKIDDADKSETVYVEGDARFNRGYAVVQSGENLNAEPWSADGAAIDGAMLSLEQTDDGIFQYKKDDGTLVLTFIFTDDELYIDEYQKDQSGNFNRESRLILKRK